MIVKRLEQNPILKPNKDNFWESEAVFNGCPIEHEGKLYLLYRALSSQHYHAPAGMNLMVSDIGIAESTDGVYFENRRRLVIPEESWERFSVEDPRVTRLNGKYFVFYTAVSEYPFNANGIKVAVAITHDLHTIDEKHQVTPFNAKGMALFPEMIDGKMWAVLTVNTDIPPSHICLISFDLEDQMWDEGYWNEWYANFENYKLDLTRHEFDQVEVGAPPIKTDQGWLMLYSYIVGYTTSEPLFTVEAVLLAFDDPRKIIARSKWPLLTPEEYYEQIGMVPNVVFPSGLIRKENELTLYYGASDTVCCAARIDVDELLNDLMDDNNNEGGFVRAKENPIMLPIKENCWESKAVFNPAALMLNDKIHIVYRAMSEDNTSVIGYAISEDGTTISSRHKDPIYTPRAEFESKIQPGGNSGCEDPRLTLLENKIYMCYTAFDTVNPPRVALSWIDKDNFLQKNWLWSDPILISPPGLDDKDAFVFPEKYFDKYLVVHRSGEDIDFAMCDNLDFREGVWLEEYKVIGPRKGWWDSRKVGAAAPPIKTKYGWIMLYHGVSDDSIYRVGAVLLENKNPLNVVGRTHDPIFEPVEDYERIGQINNVVFPCGNVLIGEDIYIYYGGADTVIGVAKMRVRLLLDLLLN